MDNSKTDVFTRNFHQPPINNYNDFWDKKNDNIDNNLIKDEDPCSAPRCFNENKRSDFAGCVHDERYPYHDIYLALIR